MLTVENLCYSYGGSAVLDGVSFTLDEGDCAALLGNNGTGKSTLITCINKIHAPKDGRVVLDGADLMTLGRTQTAKLVAYVAQKNELSQTTVFDSVLLGRKPYIKLAASQNDMDICEGVIEKLGLGALKLRYIDRLSGGELQKVMLARALVQQPRLLLLDEPTSSLDPKSQYETMHLVRSMVDERKISALIVLHDLNLALRCCNKFVLMKNGSAYKYGGPEIMTSENISEAYGVKAEVAEAAGHRVVIIE